MRNLRDSLYILDFKGLRPWRLGKDYFRFRLDQFADPTPNERVVVGRGNPIPGEQAITKRSGGAVYRVHHQEMVA